MVHARRATRRGGAYAALGIALGLVLGDPVGGEASAAPAQGVANHSPHADHKPSPPPPVEGVAERVAAALEAHNSYEQSAKAQQDAHDSAQAAKDAAYWAKWLGIAGLVETVVTIVGVILVGLTLRAARESAREAKRGADEMKRSADAALEALELARRPRIHVRAVLGDFEDDAIKVSVVYVNRGEETAFIHRLDCDVFYRNATTKKWNKRPFVRDIVGAANTPVPIANGGFKEGEFTFHKPDVRAWHEVSIGAVELCLIGHIRYTDKRDITRRTGFMWTWHKGPAEFLPAADPRWSYED
jgi:hypothetical protein